MSEESQLGRQFISGFQRAQQRPVSKQHAVRTSAPRSQLCSIRTCPNGGMKAFHGDVAGSLRGKRIRSLRDTRSNMGSWDDRGASSSIEGEPPDRPADKSGRANKGVRISGPIRVTGVGDTLLNCCETSLFVASVSDFHDTTVLVGDQGVVCSCLGGP